MDDRWGGPAQRLGTALALASFPLILGVMFRNPQLIGLAEAALGVIFLSWLWARLVLAAVGVERVPAERVFEDDDARLQLVLQSKSPLFLELVEVEDRFPAGAVPRLKALVETLPAWGRVPVQFEARVARGRGTFELGPVRLAASDPLGLFRLEKEVPASRGQLVVFPRPLPLRELDLESSLLAQPFGARETARPGRSSSFLGLREYQPGDPVRRIHWRASARRAALLVTQFEAPTHSDVTVALDLDKSLLSGLGRGSNVEVAIRLAAALANHAIGEGRAVQLLARDEELILLPPRTGDPQLISILHTLAHVQARGELPYVELLEQAAPLLKEGSSLVLIFNSAHTVHRQRLEALWSEWRRRGVRPVAFWIDDRAFLRRERRALAAAAEPIEEVLARLAIPTRVLSGPQALEEAAGERNLGSAA